MIFVRCLVDVGSILGAFGGALASIFGCLLGPFFDVRFETPLEIDFGALWVRSGIDFGSFWKPLGCLLRVCGRVLCVFGVFFGSCE